jgi:hypothetical protein
MKTIQAYRFALDLTPTQERQALAHAGAARVAHNWALARVKAVMRQRAAERSYGVPDDRLTPAVSWSLPALRKAWNATKGEVAPWWAECSTGCGHWAGRCRGRPARTAVPANARRTGGSALPRAPPGRTPGWRTCAETACISSPPG